MRVAKVRLRRSTALRRFVSPLAQSRTRDKSRTAHARQSKQRTHQKQKPLTSLRSVGQLASARRYFIKLRTPFHPHMMPSSAPKNIAHLHSGSFMKFHCVIAAKKSCIVFPFYTNGVSVSTCRRAPPAASIKRNCRRDYCACDSPGNAWPLV